MDIIENLVYIGYTPEQAKKLYEFYKQNDKLDGLIDYIKQKLVLGQKP